MAKRFKIPTGLNAFCSGQCIVKIGPLIIYVCKIEDNLEKNVKL
jgi:hypothetical protein